MRVRLLLLSQIQLVDYRISQEHFLKAALELLKLLLVLKNCTVNQID